MDIHSLLSPSDDDAKPARKPPGRVRRTPSGLSQEITRSPDRTAPVPSPSSSSSSYPGPPRHPSPGRHQHQQQQKTFGVQPGTGFRPLPTSNPSHEVPASYQNAPQYSYPQQYASPRQRQQRPVVAHRPSSNPQVDTLADLASPQPQSQRQQTTRTYSANSVRSSDRDRQLSPLHAPLHAPPISRSISRQSLADLTMAEAPAQTPPPRDFTSNALSEAESTTVMQLLNYLAENSYAYHQHLQLINLLHKGFLAHLDSPADGVESFHRADPHSYALLTEMRQARDAMDTRFAVGEDIWSDWLHDEMFLAKNSEDRIAVIELCQRALQDEPMSVKLWKLYVDWTSTNYEACNDIPGSDQRSWTVEDKEVCKELFTRDMLLNVLEQAVSATQWRVDESHIVWNRYAQFVQQEFPQVPSDDAVKSLHNLFVQRLQVPHSAREETMQNYWPVISKYEGNHYEDVIAEVTELARPAKEHTDLRRDHEFKLERATQGEDRDAIQREYEKYLKSEKFAHKKPGPFDYDLRCALYERALLRFPTATEWWLDYVDFVINADDTGSKSILPIIERATRHCPWSGDLWGRRILRADVEQKPRQDIENTKHRATNGGLLDAGGMEELVKMLQQWCSYLRRHAFRLNSSEDDVDTAEVGITMALEDVQQAGKKTYGEDFKGDPLFRLEKIQIKFLSQARRFTEARDVYRRLSLSLSNSHDFWAHFYNWELWLWGYDRIREPRRIETSGNGPHIASEVVSEALRQKNLDWPEKTLDLYLMHFQQHESGSNLQKAMADARDFSNRLAVKRAKEAEEAKLTAALQYQQNSTATQLGDKRKREDEHLTNGAGHKKIKADETGRGQGEDEQSASVSAQVKRDREHNTITLKNIHVDVEEADLRKFFRDCGEPVSINIVRENDGQSAIATVEFESHEDVLAAKTRNGKPLKGREVQIQSGDQTTLYVANYPAEWDESAVRSLFKSYGEIVSVRFPSLKFNARRRFCYVQFLTTDMAKAAESTVDGKKLDGMHTIIAKISAPDAKKQRSGAQVEGREVIVKNIDREAGEDEIKELFSQYGHLEKVNLLRLTNNKLTGTGFFVYSTAEEAAAAVDGANNIPFRDRILHVAMSDPKGRAPPQDRARKEDIIVKKDGMPSASPEPNARRGSDASMKSAAPVEQDNYRNARERKIAIFNLPDTVNDARIRTVMEQYGPITKIQLRREHRGAIIEYGNVKDAFNVRSGVDVSDLGPDAKTGDVGEFLASQKKKKPAAAANGSGPIESSSSGSSLAFVPAAATRAAGQPRGGRRGGLGFKRGGGAFKSSAIDAPASGAAAGGGKKSNADFRNIFEAGKKKEEPSSAPPVTE